MVTTNNDSEDEEILEVEESSEDDEVQEVEEDESVESSEESEEYTAIWKQIEGRRPIELLRFSIKGAIVVKRGIYVVAAPNFTSACEIAKIEGGEVISVGGYSEE